MKICKDCLHYEACKGTYDTIVETIDTDSFDHEHYADTYYCDNFTDRSEWVHLPCKVGDVVYQTDEVRLYKDTIRKIDISSIGTIYYTESIAFDERAIGKSIFLTSEEAEKALKGYENESNSKN